MKKTYKAPTTKVRIVAVHQMLCTSPNDLMDTSDCDAFDSGNDEKNLSKEDDLFGW